MLSTPTVPDFMTMTLALLFGLSAVTAAVLLALFNASRAGFATPDMPAQLVANKTIFLNGRVKRRAFYASLALQFGLATVCVLWLDGYDYLPGNLPAGHGGIGAYLDADKSADEIRLSRILACDWSDRFRLSTLLSRPDTASFQLENSAGAQEFIAFAKAMEINFQMQAPMAVQSLTERLHPVFIVLGGMFLVVARGLVRQGEDDPTLPVRAIAQAALLAFCFVHLAYFAILSYHASTEVARAFAAGRVVCTSHVAPFFIAQSQALSVSAIGLLGLFVMSPRQIFRSL